MRTLARLVLCAAVLSSTPLAQIGSRALAAGGRVEVDLFVVDASGAGDFRDLPEAVAAAAPGDVVLVRPTGGYSGFVLEKGITIQGEAGANASCTLPAAATLPCVLGSIEIRNVPAQQNAVVRSLVADGRGVGDPTLIVEDCEGAVWIEDCHIQSCQAQCFSRSRAYVSNSPRVVVARSSIEGSLSPSAPGSFAFSVLDDASVFSYENHIAGSDGVPMRLNRTGGNGVLVAEAFLFDMGSTLLGGQGAAGTCIGQQCAVQAGIGGWALGADMDSATIVGTTLVPGAGNNPSGCCPGSPDGNALFQPVTTLALPVRSCAVESPVRAGGTQRVTVRGQALDTVFTLHSPDASVSLVPSLFGSLLVGDAPRVVARGSIPVTGVLELDLPVPVLPASVSFQKEFVQALMFDFDETGAFLSSGSAALLLR